VQDVKVIKSSGDIRLDRAVEEAARHAKPFPPGTRGFEFTYSTSILRKPQAPESQPAQDDAAGAPEV
jgi:TonB family protein